MKPFSPSFYARIRFVCAVLFFIGICLTFAGVEKSGLLAKIQFFPALNANNFLVVGTVLLATFLFGRFYCSIICPLGFLQEIIALLARRKAYPDKNRRILRYGIAGLVFACFATGSMILFAASDPYALFGRIFSFLKNPAFIAGAGVFIVLNILVVWKQRFFCTSLCPVGTLLGAVSKIGLFKLRFSDSCIRCGKCSTVCPSGCIDAKNDTLDNERCVRCLKCLAVCPVKGVGFFKKQPPKQSSAPKTDLSKRAFLTGFITTAAAVGTGAAIGKKHKEILPKLSGERPICPPGAFSAEKFATKCIACNLCVSACPSNVLQPPSDGFHSIHLAYGTAYCLYDCVRCSNVCPAGALSPLTLAEKQKCRIGMVQLFKEKCVGCGKCVAMCPQGALELKENKSFLKPQYCIGCGACVSVCPVDALRVVPVVVQGTSMKGIKQ